MANQASQGLLSPFLQSQRLAAARPHISGAVLDIGCGNGALAEYCSTDGYYGFDIDAETVEVARAGHPGYRFETRMPDADMAFDTISSLAVIEHLSDPGGSLQAWAAYLKPGGKMVLTTPLPALEWAHELGAKVGLFSHDAAEEHEVLIDRPALEKMLAVKSLRIDQYRTFLGGANQLFILKQA
jgi:2-polyprenyl-3-methyl-5-hydroxy-6-metoxy-1,4-benzoquinol methylase